MNPPYQPRWHIYADTTGYPTPPQPLTRKTRRHIRNRPALMSGCGNWCEIQAVDDNGNPQTNEDGHPVITLVLVRYQTKTKDAPPWATNQ